MKSFTLIIINQTSIVSNNLLVKQRCESEQFVAINENMEMVARVFISNEKWGEESKTEERQKERVC